MEGFRDAGARSAGATCRNSADQVGASRAKMGQIAQHLHALPGQAKGEEGRDAFARQAGRQDPDTMTANASSASAKGSPQGKPAAPAAASRQGGTAAPAPKGPLEWRLLLAWLTEDKVLSLKDAELVAQRFAAGDSAQHPLVRIAG